HCRRSCWRSCRSGSPRRSSAPSRSAPPPRACPPAPWSRSCSRFRRRSPANEEASGPAVRAGPGDSDPAGRALGGRGRRAVHHRPTAPTGAQPNTPCPPKDSSGNQPAPSKADAHAEELKSDAAGYYAGGNAGVPGSGASGESHSIVNPDGTLVVMTHSFVNNATFGTPPNAIVINKVLVDTKVIIAGGVASVDAKVTVGSVTVNGQPVELSDQGATYQEKTVSCVPNSAPPPPALPGGIAPPAGCAVVVETDTFKLYTVAPVKTVSGNHGTVKASGVHVVATHPAPA